ncbi:putative C2H2 finger domain protein [Pyronema domesticum]|uniref:Similar to Zinc finger protein 207 acc. no. O43670 n=1 Tax=Pyronema omphalodes (strain CBS 100304) TaxID=1076935 RepID=U4LTC7_PYROM|nr:putative C2H2 finger domain protein [Pyronema domesticum]CCX30716.1 Similar to Zinc finger protein 207; acc. no. O43670 [Pyronema omphalodes CBS 100304]
MTKKKRRQNPEIEDLIARPWCYYCERDFDDLKILIHHQKAKHFKCERCSRRLNTAGGLRVHMEQVHKETLEQVENALPGRESIDLEIFGTEGIPESEVAAHNQRIMAEFAQKEADRRAASGQSNGPKKPKIDISKELDPAEIKRKLEEHKKAMANGGITPVTPGGAMSPGRAQSPGGFEAHGSPQVPPHQVPYGQSPPPQFQQAPYAMPPQQNAFPQPNAYPPANFPPQQAPPNPYPAAPFQQPPFQPAPQPVPFGRGAPQPQFNGYQQPPAGYPPAPYNGPPQQQQQHQPHFQPPARQHQQSSLPQPHQIPGLPPKPNVPGLPPRPAFTNHPGGFGRGNMSGPPPQQQWNPPHQPQHFNAGPPAAAGFGPPYGMPPQGPANQYPQPGGYGQHPPQHQQPQAYPPPQEVSANATPLGQQRIGLVPEPSLAAPAPTEQPALLPLDTTLAPDAPAATPVEPPTPAVKPKREVRHAYPDTDISPEEKRAALPKYGYKGKKGRENTPMATESTS